jgi:cytochrome c-type biogenesis protein CcmH/NrfF
MVIFTLIFVLWFGQAIPTPLPVTDDTVNAISKNLYCPVCQNVSLYNCPTEACTRWKEQVRELASQGKTEPEIRQYFIDKFGMRTVGVPTDPIGQWISIGMPALLILIIGGVLAYRVMQRRSVPSASVDSRGCGDEVVASVDYATQFEDAARKNG